MGEVVAALERRYPPETAMDWDRVGLVSGDPAQGVRLVHYAVDPTLAVIEEATRAGADLLVTHHPLLLRGVHSVATTSAKGASVTALVIGDLALYVAHTNADVARPGVSDALADALGLTGPQPLERTDGDLGIGRVGELPEATTLAALATRLADLLPSAPVGIRVAGDPNAPVRRVAVAGGAGDDLFDAVRASGADAYVTADLRHHPALEAREESRGGPPYLLDVGHWASEWLWLPTARDALLRELGERGARLDTHVSTLRTDPWDFVVGTGGGADPIMSPASPGTVSAAGGTS